MSTDTQSPLPYDTSDACRTGDPAAQRQYLHRVVGTLPELIVEPTIRLLEAALCTYLPQAPEEPTQ